MKEVGIDVLAPAVPGAAWQLVPGSEFTGPDCWYFQATPGTLSFPTLAWKSCGANCELADVVQGYPVEEANAVSASTTQGVAYARFSYFMKDDVSAKLLSRVVRLSDGVTLAALLQDDHGKGLQARCYLSESRYSARFVDLMGPEPENTTLSGISRFDADHAWVWAHPPASLGSAPAGKSMFTTDSAAFLVGAGGVYALLDMTKNDWTAIEAPSTARFAGGDGDLAVWTESSSNRIRAWAADGKGVRTLLETAPDKTRLVQPSQTRLVGVAVDPDYESSYSTSVRFWHAPRTYGPSPQPTVLPASASGVLVGETFFRTWGDFAAVQVFDHLPGAPITTDSIWLLVVHLPTAKAWRVEAAAGYRVQGWTWAFDDTWLYFGETLPNINHEKSLKQIRRIRLTDLDSWGKILK